MIELIVLYKNGVCFSIVIVVLYDVLIGALPRCCGWSFTGLIQCRCCCCCMFQRLQNARWRVVHIPSQHPERVLRLVGHDTNRQRIPTTWLIRLEGPCQPR